MKNEKHALNALAGEYYTASELARNGLIPAITVGNMKNVDILLSNSKNNLFRIEVKTTEQLPIIPYKLLVPQKYKEKAYYWMLDEKHESMEEKNQIFAFVFIPKDKKLKLRLFLMPALEVKRRIIAEQKEWQATPDRKGDKHRISRMRGIHIFESEAPNFENNFKLLEKRFFKK